MLAELETRVLAVDGGRLKLEWGTLRTRGGEVVDDFLWRDADRLLGFLGLYVFGGGTVEISGMVDPGARRQGIATALLEAALPMCRERGYQEALLVTPRGSDAGRQLALSRGAVLEHSEHALVALDAPPDAPHDPQIGLRTATLADAAELSRLLTAAFGEPPSDPVGALSQDSERTLVVERAGSAIGTVRVSRDGETADIYGFAIDPAWQGRGIGRAALRRVCRELRADGVRRIGLEVAVDNDRALGLYTSLGFTLATTEDYYALSTDERQR